MTGPVFVLRPEPGLTATLAEASGRGIPARGMPLARIEPVAWKAPAEQFDALLIGSANAVRHAGAELDKLRHLPVLAVGAATARAAQAAGLVVEQVGEGGMQDLLDRLDERPRRLLRLTGEPRLPVDSPPATAILDVNTYAAEFLPMTPAQAELLAKGGVAMLHSGAMASHFASQCEMFGVDKRQVSIAAMAARIADMAGAGWRSVHTAPGQTGKALLELAARLCQTHSL